MVKKVFTLIAVVLCFMCLFSHGEAVRLDRYWNDDPNYPFVGGHAGYFQYLDLSSCTFVSHGDAEKEYEIAACWVGYHKLYDETTYGIIRFRKQKSKSRPEFYNETKEAQWIVMPRIPQGEAARREGLPYADFRMKYHTWEYRMFTLTYERLFGKKYID